ncbi:hypothetical protein [Streptomyces sp. Inha503]|uniref:hypothetical protein n=1 Tax=Streptomyces sp. Inha503 TaxID=3383314 RepID=UPI0039A15A40
MSARGIFGRATSRCACWRTAWYRAWARPDEDWGALLAEAEQRGYAIGARLHDVAVPLPTTYFPASRTSRRDSRHVALLNAAFEEAGGPDQYPECELKPASAL